MTHQDQILVGDEHASTDQALAAMRELTAEELLAVVGGPIIDNGNAIAPPTLAN